MIRHTAVFRLTSVLAIIMGYLISPLMADMCLWCDPQMSQIFMDCFYAQIPNDPTFSNLPPSSLIDMKNSMLAASSAITRSTNSMKMSMMNGAMAGEVAELISTQSGSQDPNVVTAKMMQIVGTCYAQASGQPHQDFTQGLGNIVQSIMQTSTNSAGFNGQSVNYIPQYYNNGAGFQQQNVNQAASNTAISNYQQAYQGNYLGGNTYNTGQNNQVQQAASQSNAQSSAYSINNQQQSVSQSNAQSYASSINNQQQDVSLSNSRSFANSINNQQKAPQAISPAGPYPINQQNTWSYNGPNTGIQQPVNNLVQKSYAWNSDVSNYGQNNQQNTIINQNDQQVDSTAFSGSQSVLTNNPTIPQNQFQAPVLPSNWGTSNQDGQYQNNQLYGSAIQNTQNSGNSNTGVSYDGPQQYPGYNSNYPSYVGGISSSSAATNVQNNLQPVSGRKPAGQAPPQAAPQTSGQNPNSGKDDDIERAIKFAETIYFILSKSIIYSTVFNENLSKNDAIPITFYIVQNALNDCGYSSFSSDIANACINSLSSLPAQCSSTTYAEDLAKTLMSQFYKKGLLGAKPVDQGSDVGIALVKRLKKATSGSVAITTTLTPVDTTTPDDAIDATTTECEIDITTTDPSAFSTTTDPDSDATTTDPSIDSTTTLASNVDSGTFWNNGDNSKYNNIVFFNALNLYFSTSSYFLTVFNQQTTKSQAISYAVRMLTSLYQDYGKSITTLIARQCAKKMTTIPANTPTEIYARIIAACITDVFSNYSLISPNNSDKQATNIASKCDDYLIVLIKKNNISNNNPTNNSQSQSSGGNGVQPESFNYNQQPNSWNIVLSKKNNNNSTNNSQSQNSGGNGVPPWGPGESFNYNQQPNSWNNGNYPGQNTYPFYNRQPQTDSWQQGANALSTNSPKSGRNQNQQSPQSQTYQVQNAPNNNGQQVISSSATSSSSSVSNTPQQIQQTQQLPLQQTYPVQNSYPINNGQQPTSISSVSSISSSTTNQVNKAIAQTPSQNSNSDSKERVRILMKGAISSIQNGKFNYDSYSTIISSLVKLVQKQQPNLGSEQAFFKVLLEALIACTQLLKQVSPDSLPNPNTSNSQNVNIPNVQNMNIPIIQNASVPNVQNTIIPLSSSDQTSVVQNNQNYNGVQQDVYNQQQGTPDQNSYAVQQPLNNYQVPQQYNGQSNSDTQQSTANSWSNAYDTGSGNQNIPLTQNYAGYLTPGQTNQNAFIPDQGSSTLNGQNGVQPPQTASVNDINQNVPQYGNQNNWAASPQNVGNYQNVPQYGSQNNWASSPQGAVNGQYIPQPDSQFNDGSYLPMNGNQNSFSQKNGMLIQGGNQNNWNSSPQGGVDGQYISQPDSQFNDGSYLPMNRNQNSFSQDNGMVTQGGNQNNRGQTMQVGQQNPGLMR